jgi:hypothetical protein
MRTLCLAFLAAAIVCAGCAASFEFRRQELLAERVKQYGKLIRWSQFEAAKLFLADDAPGRRSPPPKDIRVSDYEVMQLILTENTHEAGQMVHITYFSERNPRVRTLEDLQKWVFDVDRNEWFLKSGFPEFK